MKSYIDRAFLKLFIMLEPMNYSDYRIRSLGVEDDGE